MNRLIAILIFCLLSALAWAQDWKWQEVRIDTTLTDTSWVYPCPGSAIGVRFDTTWFCSWSQCEREDFALTKTQPEVYGSTKYDCLIGSCCFLLTFAGSNYDDCHVRYVPTDARKDYRHLFGIMIDTLPRTVWRPVDSIAFRLTAIPSKDGMRITLSTLPKKPTARRTGMFFVDSTFTLVEFGGIMIEQNVVDTTWIFILEDE